MSLKLDFNERADSIPEWLSQYSPNLKALWKYPDRQKVEALIAKKFYTNPDSVFLSNGGDESIELLFKMCKLNAQEILLPLPAFSQYTHQLAVWGIENTLIESLPDLSIDVDTIMQNLKPNQWLIITRPNNPTGECINDTVLNVIIEKAQSISAYVFLDEAYVEFYQDRSDVNYALRFDNVISLRTFSKAYGLAGARLGYLIGNKDLIKQFKKFAMPFNVNQVSLQLAQLALENTTEVENYSEAITANRKVVYNFLQSCQVNVFNGKGNFLLFKLAAKKKLLLSLYLGKLGIQIKTELKGLPDCVRITIPENITLLLSALKTIFQPEIIGFDMDDVLIDTSQSYDECIIKTVQYFTKDTIEIGQIIELREKGGYNNDWDLSQALIKNMGKTINYDDVVKQFQIYYQDLKQYEINLLKQQSIKALFNKKHITAIITGRPKREANDGVKQLNINPDYIISADDVSQQKPSPEGINWLRSTANKKRMWFCGDTVDDMQAGMASGCVCIGIGKNTENLYVAGADIVLNNINELSELL